MAFSCGYSVSRFSALYAEQFGCSPKADLISARIEQAKQMLKAANLNASVPSGGSVVTAQSISAEQQVTLGTVVELQTADPEPEPEPETESSDEEQAEQQE